MNNWEQKYDKKFNRKSVEEKAFIQECLDQQFINKPIRWHLKQIILKLKLKNYGRNRKTFRISRRKNNKTCNTRHSNGMLPTVFSM